MRRVKGALVMVGALALCAAISAPAGAAERREAPKERPVAYAACPPCVAFGAAAVARAAIAVRAASAARPIVAAGAATRAAAAVAQRVTRSTVRRVQRQARKISRRGDKWIKDNWPRFKPEVQACLATVAFMEAHGYLRDRILRKREWSEYAIFGPRLVPATETLSINFPIRFDGADLVNASDEAIECAVGLGFTRFFEKS